MTFGRRLRIQWQASICLFLFPYGFLPFDPMREDIVHCGGHIHDADLRTVQGVYIAGQFKFVITGPLESLLYLEIKFN
jgi:hypothetical protein